jgi:methyl-accepting chemotaxis protein
MQGFETLLQLDINQNIPAAQRVTVRLAIFAAVALLALIWATCAIYLAGSRMIANTREIAEVGTALRNHTVGDMVHDGLRSTVYAAIANDDIGSSPDILRQEQETHIATFRSSIEANKSLTLPERVRSAIDAVEKPLDDYFSAANDVIETSFTDHKAAISKLPEFEVKFGDLENSLDLIGDELQSHNERVQAQSAEFARKASLVFAIATAIVLGAIAILALYFWRKLVKPIRQIRLTMAEMVTGNLQAEPGSTERMDEIGAMARAVEALRQTSLSKLELEKQAMRQRDDIDKAREATEAERRNRHAAETATAKDQQAFLETLAGGLSRLASGDLQQALPGNVADAFKAISTDFNATSDQLRLIANRIGLAVGAVKAATSEIGTGVNDLSNRTEQQASALEETAASMEQISATVRQNAENAQEANRLAAVTRQLAVGGHDIANHAVAAMDKIEQSSQQVSDITALIQEIAFQTNILALNAAVEAARAGEAGRGFAVVANEVRALAQRSAVASRDIKQLIANTSGNVAEGVGLVKQAGSSLTEITDSVRRVADIVSEIAAASQEQAAGIDQVSRAITNMDEMTQHNAALVEETNAALTSAQIQVEELRQAVNFFRTGAAPQPVPEPDTTAQLRRLAQKMLATEAAEPPTGGDLVKARWKEF